MQLLEDKIRAEGEIIGNDIVKVDMFLNHRIDTALLFQMGEAWAEEFRAEKPDLVLTVEASGIAMAVARIARCFARDEHAVLPVSTALHGQYGIEDVHLSVPAIVGKDGVETIREMPLSEKELAALRKSADALKAVIKEAEKTLEG